LLRRSEDVDGGREAGWFIESTDPDKTNGLAGARIVAPHRDGAFWAARNSLPLAAIGWDIDDGDIALQQFHTIGFDHGIEGKRRTGFSLAPTAMAAMNE
jgi:hypothetical protein